MARPGEAPIATDLRNAAALVFVGDLDAPLVSEEDEHHLIDVLRIRSGSWIALSDGKGRWRRAEVLEVTASGPRRGRRGSDEPARVVLGAYGTIEQHPSPAPELTVAFSVPKGDRLELVVQKLTELGIDTIAPLITKRTVARADGANSAHRAQRLQRVAMEAAAQSRRLFLPVVHAPSSLERFLADAPSGAAIAEPGGGPLSSSTRCILVGPEGGWESGELPSQLTRVGLGPTILRVETAAIAAGVLLASLRSGAVVAR